MSEANRIRVLVVEDNFYARLGTLTFLEECPDVEVVGEASDGSEALTKFRSLCPDVVVTDLKMPSLDGAALTALLAKENPPARVLVLTHYEGDQDILRALRSGARGYLTKEAHGEELVSAVRAVFRGERYFPPHIAGRLADCMACPSLSPRELQVLRKVFDGLSNREIAAALAITERTAGLYVSKVLAKLQAKSRTEAVRIALSRGIL